MLSRWPRSRWTSPQRLLLAALLFTLSSSLFLTRLTSADSSCDADSSSSDCGASLSPASSFDPYAPPAVALAEEELPSAAGARVKHLWTTPVLVTQVQLPASDVGAFNRALSKRAQSAMQALLRKRKREADREKKQRAKDGAIVDASAPPSPSSEDASSVLHRGDSAQGINEQFFAWQKEQHARGKDADSQSSRDSQTTEKPRLQPRRRGV